MNQKPSYIKIKSISEIDTNKLSISQVNQKFIDEDKNRYVLRFNKVSRRIEILKVLPNQELELVNSGLVSSETIKPQTGDISKNQSQTTSSKQKNTQSSENTFKTSGTLEDNENVPTLVDESLDLNIFQDPPPRVTSRLSRDLEQKPKPANTQSVIKLTPINAFGLTDQQRIEYFFDLLSSQRDRLEHIIENLKDSKIFEATGDPSDNKNIVGNFERELEFDVFQEVDKITSLQKEMINFPRQISYYISRLPLELKDIVKEMPSDKHRLDYILVYEMKRGIDSCLKKMKQFSMQLLSLINLKSETQVKQLQYQHQLLFINAKNAAIFFAQELDGILNDLKTWIEANV